MKISELALQLGASIYNPYRLLKLTNTKNPLGYDEWLLADLDVNQLSGRHLRIYQSNGQFLINFHGTIVVHNMQFEDLFLFRLTTERYAGIIEPILKMTNAIW